MSISNIQFQKGLSLPEFYEKFGSREQCEKHFYNIKWPGGFICPKCRDRLATSFQKNNRTVFQCHHCGHQTSLFVGTLFERTHLPLKTWYLALYLISEAKTSIAALDLHRKLGVNNKTASLMLHKIMAAMTDNEKRRKIGGRVEMDDAYLGGKLKGGKSGRGSENKQAFIAAVETNEENHPLYIKIDPVESFSRKEVERWTDEHIKPHSLVVTDGLDCFVAVEKTCRHEIHITKNMCEPDKELHFKWVNTILANLKTSLTGTFHSIEVHKYAFRYFGAFVYRFNRRWDLTKIFYDLCETVIMSSARTAKQLRC